MDALRLVTTWGGETGKGGRQELVLTIGGLQIQGALFDGYIFTYNIYIFIIKSN
jgi:hypothetical protein